MGTPNRPVRPFGAGPFCPRRELRKCARSRCDLGRKGSRSESGWHAAAQPAASAEPLGWRRSIALPQRVCSFWFPVPLRTQLFLLFVSSLLDGALAVGALAKVGGGNRVVYIQDHCWQRLRRRPEDCCKPPPLGNFECWHGQRDKFGLQFTYERCCTGVVEDSVYAREVVESDALDLLPPLFDIDFALETATPTAFLSPHELPTVEEPFIFLHDRRVGGTEFKQRIWLSAWSHGLLNASSIQGGLMGDRVPLGTPFFVHVYPPRMRQVFRIVAGHQDWRVFAQLRGPDRVRARCLVALRDPVERFLSFYAQRSDRAAEEAAGTPLYTWSPQQLARYLLSVRSHVMGFDGSENGIYGTADGLHVYAANATRKLLSKRFRLSDHPTETWSFRANGGPESTLTRLLDPDTESLAAAKDRLRRCVVVQLTSPDVRDQSVAILRAFFPWVRMDWTFTSGVPSLKQLFLSRVQVKSNDITGHTPGKDDAQAQQEGGGDTSQNRDARAKLLADLRQGIAMRPDLRKVIEAFNEHDVELFQFGLKLFEAELLTVQAMRSRPTASLPAFTHHVPLRLLIGAGVNPDAFWRGEKWQAKEDPFTTRVTSHEECDVCDQHYRAVKAIVGPVFAFSRTLDRPLGMDPATVSPMHLCRGKAGGPYCVHVQVGVKLLCFAEAWGRNDVQQALTYLTGAVEMAPRMPTCKGWQFTPTHIVRTYLRFAAAVNTPFSAGLHMLRSFIWVVPEDLETMDNVHYLEWDFLRVDGSSHET